MVSLVTQKASAYLLVSHSFIHSQSKYYAYTMVSGTVTCAGYTAWNSKGICGAYRLLALFNLMFQGH